MRKSTNNFQVVGNAREEGVPYGVSDCRRKRGVVLDGVVRKASVSRCLSHQGSKGKLPVERASPGRSSFIMSKKSKISVREWREQKNELRDQGAWLVSGGARGPRIRD